MVATYIVKILRLVDSLYQRKICKEIYTYFLCAVTIILLFILPFFIYERNQLGSFIFDLFARLFVTYSFCSLIYFVSHLDQFYNKFYSGMDKVNPSKPDEIKRFINILAAIFVGVCSFVFYHLALNRFLSMIDNWSLIISAAIGIFLTLPLLSQYEKR